MTNTTENARKLTEALQRGRTTKMHIDAQGNLHIEDLAETEAKAVDREAEMKLQEATARGFGMTDRQAQAYARYDEARGGRWGRL